MPGVDISIKKKNIEIKRHSQVVNVLKKSVGATTITKQILNVGVNFTVSK